MDGIGAVLAYSQWTESTARRLAARPRPVYESGIVYEEEVDLNDYDTEPTTGPPDYKWRRRKITP